MKSMQKISMPLQKREKAWYTLQCVLMCMCTIPKNLVELSALCVALLLASKVKSMIVMGAGIPSSETHP